MDLSSMYHKYSPQLNRTKLPQVPLARTSCEGNSFLPLALRSTDYSKGVIPLPARQFRLRQLLSPKSTNLESQRLRSTTPGSQSLKSSTCPSGRPIKNLAAYCRGHGKVICFGWQCILGARLKSATTLHRKKDPGSPN